MFKSIKFLVKMALFSCFAASLSLPVFAHVPANSKAPAAAKTATGPKITQIDIEGLRKLIKPNGKPLLINFWATWCDPCREEFPDLVKLDTAYRGKIDLLTVSLDDLADINGDVPKFLSEMKAEMPAFLLHTPDESAAITMVSKDWAGNLPLTILFTPAGDTAYLRNGKLRYAEAITAIDKLLIPAATSSITNRQITELPINSNSSQNTFEKGVADAQRDFSVGNLRRLRYGLTVNIPAEQLDRLRKKYSISVEESGCLIVPGYDKYVVGYNSATKKFLQKKFGADILPKIAFAPTEIPVSY